MEKFDSLDNYSDYDVLSVFKTEIFVFGCIDLANINMHLVLERILAIDVMAVTNNKKQQIKYPYELFKNIISNLSIFM